MPLFDDDEDGYWAARFGMTPDDWRQAKDAADDAARQSYQADTQAMAAGGASSAPGGDGASMDKFQTAYQGQMDREVAQRAFAVASKPPAMAISDDGLDFIKGWEKYSPKAYEGQDNRNQTIGWGHRILPGEDYASGIDIESAEKLFRNDVAQAENAVRRHIQVPLNQNQYDALVSLAYNTGAGNFAKSDVVKSLQRGDYQSAAQQFGSLNHVYDRKLGRYVVSRGNTRRRVQEAAQFTTPPSR